MPIRLVLHSPDNFELEVGLLPIPDSSQFNRKNQLQITPCQTDVLPFAYSFSRLSRDTVTYFSVGNVPAPTYRITTSTPISVWPNVITGINENGTLFDGVTRKKLPVDADTEVNHIYLILTKSIYLLPLIFLVLLKHQNALPLLSYLVQISMHSIVC